MQQKTIFVTADIGMNALQRLEAEGFELEVYPEFEPPPRDLILEKVRSGICALITTARDPIDEEVFREGRESLRVVAQYAVGYDNVDVDAASRHGIPFANTADVLTDATAEFALFMMGCLARKLYPAEEMVRASQWRGWHAYLPFLGEAVSGRTLSVIGAGRIGKALLLKCSGLDMDLLFHRRTQDAAFEASLQEHLDDRFERGFSKRRCLVRQTDLPEALEKGDFVSLHLPLTEETRALIGRSEFRRMQAGAFLVNTSRGAVVDEQALYDALKSGEIAGAALDVYQSEPLPGDSPLRDPELVNRLRLFPHFGSAAEETRLSPDPETGMVGRCVQAVLDVLKGNYDGNPARMPYVVNKRAFLDR